MILNHACSSNSYQARSKLQYVFKFIIDGKYMQNEFSHLRKVKLKPPSQMLVIGSPLFLKRLKTIEHNDNFVS